MNHETRFSPPVVGGSSLLVIFAVLCLTVFALLGLSTVQAGGRLSEASAQAVADYYAADTQAEEIFAQLRSGELPEGVEPCSCLGEEGYTYTCSISDTRQLAVEVHNQLDGWSVGRWQAESVEEYNEESGALNLWDGMLF